MSSKNYVLISPGDKIIFIPAYRAGKITRQNDKLEFMGMLASCSLLVFLFAINCSETAHPHPPSNAGAIFSD